MLNWDSVCLPNPKSSSVRNYSSEGRCLFRPLEAFGLTDVPGWANLYHFGRKANRS